MKMLTNYLLIIIAKYHILRENNFTDIFKDTTEPFIKIMNMIIEDTKTYKKLL